MASLPRLLGKLHPISPAIAPGGAAPAAANPLPVSISGQEQQNWCWCAVGSGIGDFYHGTATRQCSFASRVLAMTPNACCGTSSGGPCDKAWYLDRALTTARCFDRMDDVATRPTTFGDVQREIDAGQPLGIRVQWRHVGAHFIAISGYSTSSSGESLVTVEDPYGPVTSTMDISDLNGAYGSDFGRWTHSYFTAQNPTGGGAAPVDDANLLGG